MSADEIPPVQEGLERAFPGPSQEAGAPRTAWGRPWRRSAREKAIRRALRRGRSMQTIQEVMAERSGHLRVKHQAGWSWGLSRTVVPLFPYGRVVAWRLGLGKIELVWGSVL